VTSAARPDEHGSRHARPASLPAGDREVSCPESESPPGGSFVGVGKLKVSLRSDDEVDAIRSAARAVGLTLQACRDVCRIGMTTRELADAAADVIRSTGGESLFRGYRRGAAPPFPGDVCISVNEEVVHGVPGDRIIRDGDLVTVDCGVRLNGWCGDGATTLQIGAVKPLHRRLARATRDVLELAIDMMEPGVLWSDIARAMQTAGEDAGFGVVRDFVGHGIGRELHEPPKVPAFVDGWNGMTDFVLRPGMVLAVEPMLTAGTPETVGLTDGWTVVTRDRRWAAHEEHTIAVRDDGVEVLSGLEWS
jgi:methionyl aminopeptidase